LGDFTRISIATRAIFDWGKTNLFFHKRTVHEYYFLMIIKQLEEKEYLLESVFKNLVDLVFVYDLEQHRIIIRNPAFNQLMRVGSDALSTINCPGFLDMVHPEDKILVKETFQKLAFLKENELMSVEARIKNALGTYTYYHTRLSVFKLKDNLVTQVLCISQDMSEKSGMNCINRGVSTR